MNVSKTNLMLGYFQSLVQHQCTIDIELRNDTQISGKITFCDNNMCMQIQSEQAQIQALPPQFAGLVNGFYLRGSAIRAVYMPNIQADLETLSSMCKKHK